MGSIISILLAVILVLLLCFYIGRRNLTLFLIFSFLIVLALIICYELYWIDIPASNPMMFKLGKLLNPLGLSYVCGIIIYFVTHILDRTRRREQVKHMVRYLVGDIVVTKAVFFPLYLSDSLTVKLLSCKPFELDDWKTKILPKSHTPLFGTQGALNQAARTNKRVIEHLLLYKEEFPTLCNKASELLRTSFLLKYEHGYYNSEAKREQLSADEIKTISENLYNYYCMVDQMAKQSP